MAEPLFPVTPYDQDKIDPEVRQRLIDRQSWGRDLPLAPVPTVDDAFDAQRYRRQHGDPEQRAIEVGDPYRREDARQFHDRAHAPPGVARPPPRQPLTPAETDTLRIGRLMADQMPFSYRRASPEKMSVSVPGRTANIVGTANPTTGETWIETNRRERSSTVPHEAGHLGYFDLYDKDPEARKLMLEMDKKFITQHDLNQGFDLHEMLTRGALQRRFGPDVEDTVLKAPLPEPKPGVNVTYSGGRGGYQVQRTYQLTKNPEYADYMRRLDRIAHRHVAKDVIDRQGGVYRKGGMVPPTQGGGTKNKLVQVGTSYRAGGKVKLPIRRFRKGGRMTGEDGPEVDDDGDVPGQTPPMVNPSRVFRDRLENQQTNEQRFNAGPVYGAIRETRRPDGQAFPEVNTPPSRSANIGYYTDEGGANLGIYRSPRGDLTVSPEATLGSSPFNASIGADIYQDRGTTMADPSVAARLALPLGTGTATLGGRYYPKQGSIEGDLNASLPVGKSGTLGAQGYYRSTPGEKPDFGIGVIGSFNFDDGGRVPGMRDALAEQIDENTARQDDEDEEFYMSGSHKKSVGQSYRERAEADRHQRRLDEFNRKYRPSSELPGGVPGYAKGGKISRPARGARAIATSRQRSAL